jgi:hypothetical protein
MTNNSNLWEVRELPDGLSLELWSGANPVLALTQGERRVVVDLPHVKAVMAGLTGAAADLAELLAAGDGYHA